MIFPVDKLGMDVSSYHANNSNTHSFILEIIMNKDQLLKLYTTRSEQAVYSRSGCRTMEKEHYCSYMTGRLLRRH